MGEQEPATINVTRCSNDIPIKGGHRAYELSQHQALGHVHVQNPTGAHSPPQCRNRIGRKELAEPYAIFVRSPPHYE